MTLLAPRDVARRLNLSVSRVVQLDREGVFPALRDSSGRRLYEAADVERFAQERAERRAKWAEAICRACAEEFDDLPPKSSMNG